MPIFPGDFPKPDEPLPKFLDDPTMAKFMAAVAEDTNPRRRLMMELLARTGMRVGELASLEDDAMVQISDTFWLRIPVGKLHNDRYVPSTRSWSTSSATTGQPGDRVLRVDLVVRDDGQPFDRRTVHRYVESTAKRAGIGHVHPHQLRHTLATQAINRGMSLEAIAALLGHRSMRMTMTYARISDRTVADEYFRVTEAVEANYGKTDALPDMRQEPTCEGWLLTIDACWGTGCAPGRSPSTARSSQPASAATSSRPGPQFIPILRRQRDHAIEHDQPGRVELFEGLIERHRRRPIECGSMALSPGPADHPCNNTMG